jgi:hypothetical protein
MAEKDRTNGKPAEDRLVVSPRAKLMAEQLARVTLESDRLALERQRLDIPFRVSHKARSGK